MQHLRGVLGTPRFECRPLYCHRATKMALSWTKMPASQLGPGPCALHWHIGSVLEDCGKRACKGLR